MSHCATLVELPDGSLMAAWYAGAYETSPDVAILAARLLQGATSWSPPAVIAALPALSLGQPVLLARTDGALWLFFVALSGREGAGWESARPFRQISRDLGVTWGPPELLVDLPGLMLRSQPLVLPGRIILPAYDEIRWQSRMLLSDDEGQTWRHTGPMITPQGNIQPCLAACPDGRLLAYLRTGGEGGVIWRSESYDRGESWTAPEPTSLPNPNSGIDLLRLESGALLLAFNDSDRLRTPLRLALAKTGEDWRWFSEIASGPGEFSYPALLQTRDRRIHLVYTHQRAHIQYASFDETWLT